MIIWLILLDVIGVVAALWLLIVVTLWEVALLPGAGVGAFAAHTASASRRLMASRWPRIDSVDRW